MDQIAVYYQQAWHNFVRTFSNMHAESYLLWVLGISLGFWIFEIVTPWRKNQGIIRRDFWLDGFYMFFNLFFVPLLLFSAVSALVRSYVTDGLALVGLELPIIQLGHWPGALQLLFFFVLRDFLQWNIHRLLHRIPFLWEIHKTHHSVQQMGFAAQMRFHPLETFVYAGLEYLPLALFGLSVTDFFIVYIGSFFIGHFNHANIRLPLGPLKYIFNNPQMHIWHHSKKLPSHLPYGMNFGLSLSLWDYLFRTAYIPKSGRDIPLGFRDVEKFPSGFGGQLASPFIWLWHKIAPKGADQ